MSRDFVSASSQSVDFGNILNFAKTDPFSCMAWINPDTLIGEIITKRLTSGNNNGYGLLLQANWELRVSIRASGGSNQIIVDSIPTISTWIWTHVAYTYDGSESASWVNMYINGDVISDTNVVNGLTGTITGASTLSIGSRNSAVNFFNGKIADARVYARENTANEIKEIASGKLNSIQDASIQCTLLWPDTLAFLDRSGNGNDGTNSGTTQSDDNPWLFMW